MPDVDSDMRGIGQTARECGLTVSALRFYDSAGVLVPAWVDPLTGYRWYGVEQVSEARLIASLRRVGMPLAEICRVLERRHDRAAVDRILAAHLRRLEGGLADARRELAAARALLDLQESAVNTTPSASRATVAGEEMAAALLAVRYAVSTDPELPMLSGVLLEVDDACVRVVATDRYRLAVSSAPASEVTGPPVSVIAPRALVDGVMDLLAQKSGPVTVDIDGDRITIDAPGQRLTGQRLDYEFPDYRRLLRTDSAHRIAVDVAQLRSDLRAAPARTIRREQDGADYEVAVLSLDPDGALDVAPAAAGSLQVGFNREFLLQALDAGDATDLVLELDGPIAPLALRDPKRAGTLSLLMPTRLPEDPAVMQV